MKSALSILLLAVATMGAAEERHPASCMVLRADQPQKNLEVSCRSIPDYMPAQAMRLVARNPNELKDLVPGTMVEFTLIRDGEKGYAEQIHVKRYETMEQDPLTARGLKIMDNISHPEQAQNALALGQPVPNFNLIDQRRRKVSFSQFAGKVVAINFVYTSCVLPTYCFRTANNFGVLQRRFKEKMGRDLILLTVTFDPQRDQPEALDRYSRNWKANPDVWHFLTGPVDEVRRVNALFGMAYYPDEGLMNHSLHTAVIDRQGKLVTNIEGNQYTPAQLGDLVEMVITGKSIL
jgi:protein SCO1/2